jgi:hypothetical protein
MVPGQFHHIEDVGRILIQVQQELKDKRENIKNQGSGSKHAADGIEEVLQRAEADLRAKAEVVLSSIVNSSVRTIPPVLEASASPTRQARNEATTGSLFTSSGSKAKATSRIRDSVTRARQIDYISNPTSGALTCL